MNLITAAAYLSDADEVQVDFRSTEDDLITQTIADSVLVKLYSAIVFPAGDKTRVLLSSITTTAEYVLPEGNFSVIFRHPQQKLGLEIDVQATYGANTFTQTVIVGQPISPQTTMNLPDNTLYMWDPADKLGAAVSGEETLPNLNRISLEPAIQLYYKVFDFSTHHEPEEYIPLDYAGGGNRLLMSNQTNMLLQQELNSPPWQYSTYCFLEGASTNFLDNPFFLNATGSSIDIAPNGYLVNSGGAILIQSLDYGPYTTKAAKMWKVRYMQQSPGLVNRFGNILSETKFPVTPGTSYCLSSFLKVTPQNTTTKTQKLTMSLNWYDSLNVFLSSSTRDISLLALRDLDLVQYSDVAPTGAHTVQIEFRLTPLQSGDDVEISVLAPQLEIGTLASSRTIGSRTQDQISFPEYNAANQKIRLQFSSGCASGRNSSLLSGAISADFTSTNLLHVVIPGQATLDAPLSFAAGDFLDLTIEHKAGDSVKVYREGQVIAQAGLPAFTAVPAALIMHGEGLELFKLSAFSRK